MYGGGGVSSKYVLALDLGTTNARCLLCHIGGSPVAVVRQDYPYASTDGLPDFARQFDSHGLANLIEELIGQALAKGGINGREIVAIGVTSQREGFAALDRRGHELYVGPNLDLRAVFEGAALDDEHGARVYRTTGHLPSFFFAPAKLMWLRENAPDTFGQIAHVISLAAWAEYRLTGEIVDEPALQGELGLLAVRRRRPAYQLLRLLGLEPEWIPETVMAGTVAGGVSATVARRIGLTPGTPVTLAGPDSHSGLVGMGATTPDQVGIVAGWSAPVQLVTDKPIFDRKRRTWTECHVMPDRWILEASTGDTGTAYERIRSLVSPDADYEALHCLAENAPVGCLGVVTFLGPRPINLSQPGLLPGGLLFPVPLTYQEIGPGHLVRATLENIGYALRACLELVEAIGCTRAQAIHLGGGMAANPVFVQLLTNILGRSLASHAAESTGVGAALCASVAAGHFRDLMEAATTNENRYTEVNPDPVTAAEYQSLYLRWCNLQRGVEKLTGVVE